MVIKHNFIAQLGEYQPYRFESIREKALNEELAQKNTQRTALEMQLEVFKKTIKYTDFLDSKLRDS